MPSISTTTSFSCSTWLAGARGSSLYTRLPELDRGTCSPKQALRAHNVLRLTVRPDLHCSKPGHACVHAARRIRPEYPADLLDAGASYVARCSTLKCSLRLMFSMSCHRKPTEQQPLKVPCASNSSRKCLTTFWGMMYPGQSGGRFRSCLTGCYLVQTAPCLARVVEGADECELSVSWKVAWGSPTLSAFWSLENATPATCMAEFRRTLLRSCMRLHCKQVKVAAASCTQPLSSLVAQMSASPVSVQLPDQGTQARHLDQDFMLIHQLGQLTLPCCRSVKEGPPLLPGLMAASIWMPSSLWLAWVYRVMVTRDTMPFVMLRESPPRG